MSTDPSAAIAEIAIRNVSKSFARHKVLAGISADVQKGEAVVVIGPSGSGKTTLLRCVNLLEQFEEGEITIGGQSMGYRTLGDGKRVRRSERELAAVRAQGMPRRQAEEIARSLLARVGLADKADAAPNQLSGGQQQRVAIARALAMRPRAILFDEVTSALDPELVGEVLDVMRTLVQEGMTMLIVTHEMAFARAFAHRVIFMADGEIVEQGEPRRLFEHPESPRLQAFLKRFKQGYQL